MKTRSLPVIAAVALSASVPLAAQDMPVAFGSDFIASQMHNLRMDSLLRTNLEAARERREARERGAPAASVARPKAAARPANAVLATGAYTPSPAVTARVREQFVRWIGSVTNEKGASEMRTVMQQQDILKLWERQMAADGLKPNNFLDAATAYYVQNWQVANDVKTTRPSQVQGARRQIAAALAGSPQFAALTKAQLQEMSEIFVYNQFVQGSAWIDADQRGDTALKARFADAAVTRFRNEWGVELQRQQLTDRGFEPRR